MLNNMHYFVHFCMTSLCFCFSLKATSPSDVALSQESWTHFGDLSKNYVAGRTEHPQGAFDIFKEYVKPDAKIVDLGSGTGISTRQLCRNGFMNVVGVDRDALMIKEAEAENNASCSITYIKANLTDGLPFQDADFDAVSAMSAFHWFSNPSSIKEIERILKPNGYFFVIGGGGSSNENQNPVRETINKMVQETYGKELPEKKVDPAKILEAEGFKIIVNTKVKRIDSYSKEQYLAFIQSLSSWNLIKNSPKVEELIKKISQYLDTVVNKDGKIIEERNVNVVLVQKYVKAV